MANIEFNIGDYKYTVTRDGEVSVRAIDQNKEQYAPIPRTVEYEGVVYTVTEMRFCFYECTSLVEAPAIPNSVTNMESCFEFCTSLVKAPAIPDSVTNMFACFVGCYSLVEEPALPDSVTAQAAPMNASFNLFDWFSKQKRHRKRRKFYYDRWVGSQYWDDCSWECALPNGYHLAHGELPYMEPWDLQSHFIMIDEDGGLIRACLWNAGMDSPLVPSPCGDVVIWIYNGSVYAWRMKAGDCYPINLSDQFNNQRVQDARMQSDGILEVLCENGEIWRYWCNKGLFFIPDENGWTQGKRDFYRGEKESFLRNPPEWFILMIRNEDYDGMYAHEDIRRICFEPGLETIKSIILRETSLEKVVIPAHVQDVESLAFSNCADLKELVIEGDLSRVADWAEDAFEGCPCEEYYKQLRNAAR